jgi:2-octaprenyl-6-methoxyphenol hydroxylase
MNICIIGGGLTSLSLAKNLINKKIKVHIYHKKLINNLSLSRTIGISKDNLKFFEKEILQLPKKIKWEIKKIEIYSEKLKKNKILNFDNGNDNLFCMVKNEIIYKALNDKLLKSKFFKKIIIKQKNFYEKLLKKNDYDLIVNCDQNNIISKKYFIKKIDKDYKNLSYTTILEHKKLENNSAIQVFTNSGPIAFLPISKTKTSVVCSLDIKDKSYNDSEILDLINKHNPKFKIQKNSKLDSFKLKSSNLRNYYYKNILAFGDLLHRIHPLAGQGFNMTIRDIKKLSEIIQNKIDLGLQLDSLILEEFQKKTKNKNFIFSSGIDFIYEFFNFDKKTKGNNLGKILKYFGTNKSFMNSIIKFADKGLNN